LPVHCLSARSLPHRAPLVLERTRHFASCNVARVDPLSNGGVAAENWPRSGPGGITRRTLSSGGRESAGEIWSLPFRNPLRQASGRFHRSAKCSWPPVSPPSGRYFELRIIAKVPGLSELAEFVLQNHFSRQAPQSRGWRSRSPANGRGRVLLKFGRAESRSRSSPPSGFFTTLGKLLSSLHR
jgi:hypothetical protein